MSTLARNITSRKKKSLEITRLLLLLKTLDLKPIDIANENDIGERTITNFIWNDIPIGGQLLRILHSKYGVSIDWILSGTGSMFLNSHAIQDPGENYSEIDSRMWRLQRFIAEFMNSANKDEQAWMEMQIKFSIPQYAQFLEQLENKNG